MQTASLADNFFNKAAHRKVFGLAMPMLLANISTPLMGLVDTAVLGHMGHVSMLAGAAVGAFFLTKIYWICGFLRMTTTGLSAQAKGQQQGKQHSLSVLRQSLWLALLLAALILIAQSGILALGLQLSAAKAELATHIQGYFSVRVWGAPAALANLALIGWMLGQQLNKQVMWLQIVVNGINLLLNLVFVFAFNWQVQGVALATVLAEYSALLLALWQISHRYSLAALVKRNSHYPQAGGWRDMLRLNRQMLVRNLALQLCLAFITFQGARLGAQTAALNAILMQFFVLIALGLDAIAYAIEALVGEAKGARNARQMNLWVTRGLLWSMGCALLYSLLFLLADQHIVALLTDQPAVRQAALAYRTLLIWLPIIAHWCFLLDAVFIGLTRARSMQYSMLISALLVFFPLWWYWQAQGNQALWFAMLGLLAARGVTLGGWYFYLWRRGRLLV